MSDITVKDLPHFEQLKAKVESKFGHVSKAETVGELVADVERISRFIVVPPEFMEMLRDIAATSERHGAGSLHTSMKIQGADPEWADLIADLDELVDFEDLKAELIELIGYPFKSRTFPTLLNEVVRIKRVMKIPDEFVEKFREIVGRHEAREAEERARETEAERMAHFEGADHDFTKRLVALARGEGLRVSEFQGLPELMERLTMLANVHSEFARKLEQVKKDHIKAAAKGDEAPVEEAVAPDGAGEECLDVAIDVEEPDVEGAEAEAADMDVEGETDSVPMFVKTYSSISKIDWGRGREAGSVGWKGNVLTMEPYGYATVSEGKKLDIGAAVEPNVSAFFLHDPLSGISVAGKFPFVSDFEEVAEHLMGEMKGLLFRGMSTRASRKRFNMLEKGLRSGMTPHEYEMSRIGRELDKLEISTRRVVGAALFLAGSVQGNGLGIPPAQVVQMLGAMFALGIGLCSVRMYRQADGGMDPIFYDTENASVASGSKELVVLADDGGERIDDLLYYVEKLEEVMKEKNIDGVSADTIRTYHLPVASGLWWGRWDELKRELNGLVDKVGRLAPPKREALLHKTYRSWHRKLPSIKAVSGKGGGGKSFRGIARNRIPGKTETPEATAIHHHEECASEAWVLGGAVLNTGILPVVAKAGAVVI
jgi:hypothetical protein